MFAVKGWAVNASALKPQTEPFKAPKPDNQDEQNQGKKRKRGGEGQKEDVGKLWEQHIEHKEPAKKQGQLKNERKKQRREKAHAEQASDEPRLNGSDRPKDAPGAEKAVITGAGTNTSKQKKKENKKKKHRDDNEEKKSFPTATANHVATTPAPLPAASVLPAPAKLTPMQSAMRQKLISARFRHLNQTLYTAPSTEALELFDQNPEMFEDYHAGFRQQVSVWPENPIDKLIATLRTRGKIRLSKHKDKKRKVEAPVDTLDRTPVALPRTHGTCIIADLGCGDARLAQMLKDSGDSTNLNLKIHSYDLHSPSPLVTKADISNLPRADGSVDVAVFCLALMGTNWISFIEEAYRILHWKGELWVAEIKSRFGRVGRGGKPVEHSVGGKKKQAALKKAQESKRKEQDEVNEQAALLTEVDGVETKQEDTDVSAFVDVLRRRGFLLKDGDQSIDLSNKMFVRMEFVKAATPTRGKGVPETDSQNTGKSAQGKKKFVEDAAEDIATDDEAKVLKPCLYKIR